MTGQQLKNSILQMAVQGKLVPQNPNDEPASVLLERIRAEKEALIKAGKIKKEKNPSVIFRGADNLPYEKVGKNEPICIADEVPFEIPDSWEWCRIRTVGSIIRGNGIKRTETVENGQPCIRYGEIYTSYNISFTNTKSFVTQELYDKCRHIGYGDVVFTLTGENKQDIAKAIAYLGKEDVAAGGDLAYWSHHKMNPLYLVYFLSSPYAVSQKVVLSTGDIIVHISADKIGSMLIPVPPIEEQNRIVAQINYLLPYLSEYEIKEHQLFQLKTAFPVLLKKTILQEAVQGKLVPQDENDEPASVLLERIRAEKEVLIKSGKIKKDKNESVIFRRDNSHYEKRGSEVVCIDDEIPFDIPDSWGWVRLKSICTKLVDGDHNPPKGENFETQYIMASSTNINNNRLVELNKVRYLSQKVFEQENLRTNATTGDLFFTSVGSLGRSCVYEGGHNICFQRSVSVITTLIYNYYLKLVFDSAYFQNKVFKEATGTAQKGFYLNQLAETLIPVPPMSEQQQIVDFVNRALSTIEAL